MLVEWLFVVLGVMILVHLAVLVYALRQRGPSVGATGAGNPARSSQHVHQHDGMQCPECGEQNEPEYRYCRQCVSELPTGVSVFEGAPSHQSRRTL
jgi:hypothetical protein